MKLTPDPADSPKVADFKALMKAFEDARDAHEDVGAGDTEPRTVGYRCIRKAAAGKPVQVPSDADGWQLYTPDEDDPDPKVTDDTVRVACHDLHRTCQAVVDFLANMDGVPFGDAKVILQIVKEWCDS